MAFQCQLFQRCTAGKLQSQLQAHPIDRLSCFQIQRGSAGRNAQKICRIRFAIEGVRCSAADVKRQKRRTAEFQFLCRIQGCQNMSDLVRSHVQRHAGHRSDSTSRSKSCEEARHIGAFQISGTGRHTDGAKFLRCHLRCQLFQHVRQLSGVVKDGVTLPQSSFPRFDGEQLLCLLHRSVFQIQKRCGSGIVAGVKPQDLHHGSLPPLLPFPHGNMRQERR